MKIEGAVRSREASEKIEPAGPLRVGSEKDIDGGAVADLGIQFASGPDHGADDGTGVCGVLPTELLEYGSEIGGDSDGLAVDAVCIMVGTAASQQHV